jgi:hypothetical protein
MNRNAAILAGAAIVGVLLLASSGRAEEKESSAVDWKALQAARASLAKGLAAAEGQGKPISAKFEMEDGKLQLSVYTARQGKFWEVVVDHTTSRISKTEEIKEGDDLSAAKASSQREPSLRRREGRVGQRRVSSRQYRAGSGKWAACRQGRSRERDGNENGLGKPQLGARPQKRHEIGGSDEERFVFGGRCGTAVACPGLPLGCAINGG